MVDAAARIAFVADHMPLVGAIRGRWEASPPFAGLSIAVRIHIEAKTAVLIEALVAGGAAVTAMGNQGTTDDSVASALEQSGVEVLGRRADAPGTIAQNLDRLAATKPDLVLDNGAELIERFIDGRQPHGATEETTSGAFRLRRLMGPRLRFPVIVINDSPLKSIVENKHGVGQSVIQEIQRATNVLLTGKRLVVYGYGWCGRGIAHYGSALGSSVTVIEPDEIKALEAAIDGYRVNPPDPLTNADLVVTATGETGVLTMNALRSLPRHAIVANAGHFDDEIDLTGLRAMAEPHPRGESITEYRFPDGHTIDLVAEGQMVNLAVAGSRGNPIEVMDLGFALQALSLERLATAADQLAPGDQPVPDDINRTIAAHMLQAMMDPPT